ncbi:MAG TPA: FHA domain-containing protein [Acidimicrobiales bacterium]|nr:FHA domain-containing protein [Acidimicrobiales bacterium]
MPDQLLNLLKIFLLLLLYLFFLRVLRAVWAEVNPPKAVEAPKPKRERARRSAPGRKHGPPVLRLVAPAELKGRTYEIGDETTIGRAAGCQVTIDDSYASQLHARVFQRDGQIYVEDIGSTNGTYLNRKKVTGPMVLQRGDQLQIGNTILELQR